MVQQTSIPVTEQHEVDENETVNEKLRLVPHDDEDQGCWGTRHTLVLLGFLGFANVYAMRVNLSVTIVAMVNQSAIPHINQTAVDICPETPGESQSGIVKDGEFAWDEYKQGIILGSFFWGYVLTQIPGGRLAELFGGRKLLGYGILSTSLFTLLTPFAARASDTLLIFCRVLMGLGEGVTFPAMYAMLAEWAPPWERSKMAAFVFTGAQFGTVITLPLSGILCEHGFDGGWPTVFYVFGTLGIVWFAVWMPLTADSPSRHLKISKEEKDYICSSLKDSIKRKSAPVPWRCMFRSKACWAVGAANVGHAWGFYTLLTELPSYMDNILHFNMKQNSFVSALPYLAMWLFSLLCSTVADILISKQIFRVITVRKIFNSIGQYGPALALIGAGFIGCDTVAAVILLTLAVGLSGASYSAFQVNFVEIAPPYAGTLFGVTNAVANLCGFMAPYAVGVLVKGNQTLGQWRLVFLIAAGVYFVSNTIFLMFASSKVQPWAECEDLGTEEPINSGDDEEESDFLSRPFPYIQPDSLF
ncbi:putative inorganic phosphate cotransporter isoform X1 [Daphnia pulex]|uniref:putative inorganic phosphate cotransporter isoform X1 n=1 Tax=Daphnia pulex TaxID=6669 RepID=UPI001EE0151B|nr:putative inorganic phosphate cotransporter isoform X1 [Daphnia pulex]